MSKPVPDVAAPHPGPEPRRGFALAGALLALVVVGALVTGSFFAASEEQAISISAKYSDDALYVAETVLDSVSANTSKSVLQALDSSTAATSALAADIPVRTPDGQLIGEATVWVRRMGNNYYLFVAKGTAARGGNMSGGSRIVGLITRTASLAFPPTRAMQIFNGLTVQGSALISGKDTVPEDMGAQWDTCSTSGTQDAIVARDSATVKTKGSGQIVGPVEEDTTLNANSFLNYGDVDYDALAAMADITYYGGTDVPGNPVPQGTATTCDTNVKDNWGEPWNVVTGCIDYFPIIHVKGDLDLASNGRGQGILLVDGNITIHGGYEFWGITITRGSVNTYGSGGHLSGEVLAFNQGDLTYDPNLAIGNSLVQYSGCAIRRAVRNSSVERAIAIRGHSWLDLSAGGVSF